MVWKIVGIALGVVAIIVVAAAVPDLKRYMRIRSM
jgi:hypothetical protein